MPARLLNIADATCPVEPLPDAATVSSPGLRLASAMNSFTVFTGSAGLTTSTSGTSLVCEMATKSLTGS